MIDMNTFLRFPGGKKKALTLSYDDGVPYDRRLIKILDENGIKGTFNLNSGVMGVTTGRLDEEEVKELYTNSGHEVAVHSLTHPFLEQLPSASAVQDVLQDRQNLEKMFDKIIRGMAYPYGTFSDSLIEALKSIDIAYARTVITTHDFRIPSDWMKLTNTCHHNDPKLGELTEKFVKEQPKWGPWLFYLWGHSYEFAHDNNWDVIENFAKTIGGRDDIWYATNIEIYNYIEAYRSLQFSVDCKHIYNPTATTVWFEKDEIVIEIQPGQII